MSQWVVAVISPVGVQGIFFTAWVMTVPLPIVLNEVAHCHYP